VSRKAFATGLTLFAFLRYGLRLYLCHPSIG